jgi:hypothetical protein
LFSWQCSAIIPTAKQQAIEVPQAIDMIALSGVAALVNFRRTKAALGIEMYLPYEVVTSHVTPRVILVQGPRVLVKA